MTTLDFYILVFCTLSISLFVFFFQEKKCVYLWKYECFKCTSLDEGSVFYGKECYSLYKRRFRLFDYDMKGCVIPLGTYIGMSLKIIDRIMTE